MLPLRCVGVAGEVDDAEVAERPLPALLDGVKGPDEEEATPKAAPLWTAFARSMSSFWLLPGVRPPDPPLDGVCILLALKGSGESLLTPEILRFEGVRG